MRVDDPVAGDACHVARLGSSDRSSGRLCDIALNEIHPNPSQPRKRFDDASLTALADSIRERGLLQPVIVQPRTAAGYELIVGERRWRASRIASIATIPTLIAMARRSTRGGSTARNRTPSARSRASWSAPAASDPSARTTRHHGTSGAWTLPSARPASRGAPGETSP